MIFQFHVRYEMTASSHSVYFEVTNLRQNYCTRINYLSEHSNLPCVHAIRDICFGFYNAPLFCVKLADVTRLPGYQVIPPDCPQWKRALIEKKNALLISEATVTF